MTHEELLALLDEFKHWDDWGFYPPLRAVVELHKPYDSTIWNEAFTFCECGNEYPCPTIQAIEEELK